MYTKMIFCCAALIPMFLTAGEEETDQKLVPVPVPVKEAVSFHKDMWTEVPFFACEEIQEGQFLASNGDDKEKDTDNTDSNDKDKDQSKLATNDDDKDNSNSNDNEKDKDNGGDKNSGAIA